MHAQRPACVEGAAIILTQYRHAALAVAVCFALGAAGGGAQAQTYSYDARGRVISVTYEGGETVEYSYDDAGNRTASTATGTWVPRFSVDDANAAEGAPVVFTVSRTGDVASATSVQYGTQAGVAGASDFTPTSGTVNFAAEELSKTVSVPTTQDAIYEISEGFTLVLSNPAGPAAILDGEGAGSIDNDDAGPSFAIGAATALESDDALVLTVTKTGATEVEHAVSYATSDGTAQAGQDYTAVSGVVAFAPGDVSKTIEIAIVDNTSFEADETLMVTLSAPTNNATISTAAGTGTIYDADDTAPSFSIDDPSVNEGGQLTFTVTLSGPSPAAHQVSYASSDITAVAGADYTAVSGVLSFAIGETSKPVVVNTAAEALYEANETLKVQLSNATGGATIADSEGTGTINNDDVGPSFAVGDVSVAEGGNLSFTVTRTGATSFTHSVNYATANGTAAAGADYTATSGTLSFAPADGPKTVTVTTTGDSTYEANETVTLNLSAATNGAAISDAQGVGTINNNDAAPSFAVNNVSVTEGGNLVFTVTKTGATSFAHAVTYATANGTATAGSDYTATSGTLSFGTSETSKTVSVTTAQENTYEANETLYLNLSGATSGASIADSQGVGTINNDDANITYVRNAVGQIQAGFTEEATYNSHLDIWLYKTKSGSTVIHVSSIDHCDASVAPIAGYSWTGNGCEMRVD
ncbi:MAG: Calx-beta domain-containing protein [Amphiplicatus sp.]